MIHAIEGAPVCEVHITHVAAADRCCLPVCLDASHPKDFLLGGPRLRSGLGPLAAPGGPPKHRAGCLHSVPFTAHG